MKSYKVNISAVQKKLSSLENTKFFDTLEAKEKASEITGDLHDFLEDPSDKDLADLIVYDYFMDYITEDLVKGPYPSDTQIMLAKEIQGFSLTPESKKTLFRSSEAIYDEIKDSITFDRTGRKPAIISLKLACDDKRCGINPLTIWNRRGIRMKDLGKARAITGIEIVRDPRERAEAMIHILKNNGYIPNELMDDKSGDSLLSQAQDWISQYMDTHPSTTKNVYITALAGIYVGALDLGFYVSYADMTRALGPTEASIRKRVRDMERKIGFKATELTFYTDKEKLIEKQKAAIISEKGDLEKLELLKDRAKHIVARYGKLFKDESHAGCIVTNVEKAGLIAGRKKSVFQKVKF